MKYSICCVKVVDEVRLEDDWVPLDEQLGAEELEEVFRAKEAHSRAVVLETVSFISPLVRNLSLILNIYLLSFTPFMSNFFCTDWRYS